MKIVYMGTPEFARRPLEYLYKNTPHDILAVVTGTEKRSGRGLKLAPTAVHQAARALDIPVFTPDSLKDPDLAAKLRDLGADIFVVVAFRILPESLYNIPPRGSINLDGSLLPRYRGAAPINWALINGETETGLTTFFLNKKVDTGDIILQEKVPIAPDETFDQLYRRMSECGGPFLEKTLALIASPDFEPQRQDNSGATPAPKLTPENCRIDWGFPPPNVVNFIRGLSSVPGAFTGFRDKKLKILRARRADRAAATAYEPGEIVEDKNHFLVAVAGGVIEILELLPEGKTRLTGSEFIRGYRPRDHEILGAPKKEG